MLKDGHWGKSISLRPNSSFLPKVVSDRHVNIPFILSAYDLPAVAGESEPPSGMLCPVRALAAYVERTRSVRTTDQLFVCYGERVLGAGLSKQKLSHWIMDTITTAYSLAGMPVLGSVVAHSTRGVAASWALLRGGPLTDICAAAGWASYCNFNRYYRVMWHLPLRLVQRSWASPPLLRTVRDPPSILTVPASRSRAGTSPLAGQVPLAPTNLVPVYQYIGVIKYSET